MKQPLKGLDYNLSAPASLGEKHKQTNKQTNNEKPTTKNVFQRH